MGLSYFFAKLMSKMQIASIKDSEIDRTSKVYEKCTLSRVKLGRYSYIAKNTNITDAKIGSFCSIGGRCQIGGGLHPTDMVSTSPVFLEGKSAVGYNFGFIKFSPSETVIIGNDVWIGSGVFIKAGVKIGSGAIIGANAVVTHDVEPYSIVAGVPAKEIRKRFDNETIERLLDLKWWDWPDDKIRKFAEFFSDPVKLLNAIDPDKA